jgi:predicted Rossmann-fold nucleotide-binding protein
MTRVLVCGGRNYDDAAQVARALEAHHARQPITLLIEGGARGVDAWAAMWARSHGIPVETFPADWNAHGKAAGPIRNRQMLTDGNPDLVIAFPGGRGTANMIRQAEAAGVPVQRAMAEKATPTEDHP